MEKPRKGGLLIGISWMIWASICLAPEAVQAQVKPTPDSPGLAVSLAGIKWDLVEAGGRRVPRDSRQPYFVLKSLDRFEGGSSGQMEDALDGCGNHLTGIYRARGNRLHIDFSTSTLMSCVISADILSPQGVEFLRGDSWFKVDGTILELLDEHGTVKGRFVAADR
jgi:heat shock protein HslJ